MLTTDSATRQRVCKQPWRSSPIAVMRALPCRILSKRRGWPSRRG